MKTLKIKIHNEALAKLYGVEKDGTLDIQAIDGIPAQIEWRNRLKDSEIDGCISLVDDKIKPNTQIKKEAK